MHSPRHALVLRKLDTCSLITTLCNALWVSSGLHIDAVEVPRALTGDTERMAKCILFKRNDKDRFYRKIWKHFTLLCDCTICYCKLYRFTLC